MKKHSFTLVELLIVLIIISIVAALAVPQYQKWIMRSRGAEAMNNLRAIADSLWQYHLETGAFPAMITGPAPIFSPIPTCIDAPPSSATKYFWYSYTYIDHPDETYVVLRADDKEVLEKPTKGAIATYVLHILKYPTNYGGEIKKLDDNWCMAYGRLISTGPDTSTDWADGWQ